MENPGRDPVRAWLTHVSNMFCLINYNTGSCRMVGTVGAWSAFDSIAVKFSKTKSLDLSWLNILEAPLEVLQLSIRHLHHHHHLLEVLNWPPSQPRA